MSIVARVFVVLNFILAIIFLVYAMQIWTAKTKWQKMYEIERKQNVELKAINQKRVVELSEDVIRKEMVIRLRKQVIDQHIMRINELRDRNIALEGRVGEAEAKVLMMQALNEELTREVSRRSDELVKIKGVVIKQQQAVQVAKDNEIKAKNEKAEMENELNAVKQSIAQLQRDKAKVEEDLALQTRRIEGLIERNVPVIAILGEDPAATQPFIPDARVLAVKPDLDLVMISVGSAQGVKPGFQFTISRADQYVAKATVERVYPDMCSARLFLKKGEAQVQDEAKSRVPAAN